MKRIALAVMRIQPLHAGHCRIIDKMIRDYETVILCIGSAQKSREERNPWTFEERKQMVRNVYGDRIKIVQLNDLGVTEGSDDWADYVIDKITKIGMPEPTDYFTGSAADGRWYAGRFIPSDITKKELKKYETGCPAWHYFVDNGKNGEEYDSIPRYLHIMGRNDVPVPAATELRTFLELRDDGWQEWVPKVNWDIVENNFSDELRVKV